MIEQAPLQNVFRSAQGGWNALLASISMRKCQRIGSRPRLIGTPHLQNEGTIEIGNDFVFTSAPVRSHIVVHRGAVLRIGDNVSFGSGCGVACHSEIEIGANTTFGAFVMILDSDYHVPGNPLARAEPSPIRIGRGVCIGSHVTILRGSVIGDGVVVDPGSVVSGEIPCEERVSGVPARSSSRISLLAVDTTGSLESRIIQTVMQTFRMSRVPLLSDGPGQIAGWNSLAAISLLTDLEAEFAVTLTEDDTTSVRQLADLVPIVTRAQSRRDQRARLLDGTFSLPRSIVTA